MERMSSLTANIGPLRSAVMDGLTIGHPCCTAHNCTQPLINNHAHVCEMHEHLLKYECRVENCVATVLRSDYNLGLRTCEDPEHRSAEVLSKERAVAFLQLVAHLKSFGITQPPDSLAPPPDFHEDGDDEVPSLLAGSCDMKSEQGNTIPKICRCRLLTHNEQLMLSRSCCFSKVFSSKSYFTVCTFLQEFWVAEAS